MTTTSTPGMRIPEKTTEQWQLQLAEERAARDDAIAERSAQHARCLRAELALAEVNDALRAAGIEHPLGAAGVRDLASMLEGAREDAEAAEAQIRSGSEPDQVTSGG